MFTILIFVYFELWLYVSNVTFSFLELNRRLRLTNSRCMLAEKLEMIRIPFDIEI